MRPLGAFCVNSADCESGICYTGGNSAGDCTAGEAGQECVRAADCASQLCTDYQCE